MSASKFAALIKSVSSGKIPDVLYLTGTETVLKEEVVARVLDAVVPAGDRQFNSDNRHASDLDMESLVALVDTPPLLVERRVVVIRGLEAWRKNAKQWKALISYVERPAESTVLVLLQDDGKSNTELAKHVKPVVIDTPGPEALVGWVVDEASAQGVKLDQSAALHLVRVAGTNLGVLKTEIAKVAAAAEDGTVSREQLANLVGVRPGETSEDFVNLVIQRDIPRATALLDHVLTQSGVTGVGLIMGIGTHLIGVRLARAHLDNGVGGSRLESKIFQSIRTARPARLGDWKEVSAFWARAASRWTMPELDRAIRAALEADRQLKSTTISSATGILTQFLLEVGTLDKVAA